MRITITDIRAAGSQRAAIVGPFKAEGLAIRNAYGELIGQAVDESHATLFASSDQMLKALKHVGEVVDPQTQPEHYESLKNAVHAAEGRAVPDPVVESVEDLFVRLEDFVSHCEAKANGDDPSSVHWLYGQARMLISQRKAAHG